VVTKTTSRTDQPAVGRQWSRVRAMALVFLASSHCMFGLDPSKKLTQYGHTAWRLRDGYFTGTPNSIAQTTDGYLWLGTEDGLWRFDGVRFTRWNFPDGKPLDLPVRSLLGSHDGSLWIGTERGILRSNDHAVSTYPESRGVISAIVERKNGEIWFTRYSAKSALCQVTGRQTLCQRETAGFPYDTTTALLEDATGDLWIGTGDGVVQWRPGSSTYYGPAGLKGNKAEGVGSLAVGNDQSLWVAINKPGPGLGLQQLKNRSWVPFVTPQLNGDSLTGHAVLLDRDNGLWAGTIDQGMLRIRGRQVDRFRSSDGLSSDYVRDLFQDHEGNIWAATSNGLDCFRNLKVNTFTPREGLIGGEVDAVLASRNGTVLVGSPGVLNIISPENGFSVTNRRVPGNQVTAMLEDHAGRLWMGIDNSLAVYQNGRFRRVNRRDGEPLGFVLTITEDVDHNVWAATKGSVRTLFRIRNFEVQDELPAPGMPGVRQLDADPQGGVWLGLVTGDLARYAQGNLEVFPFKRSTVLDFGAMINQVMVNPDGSVLGAALFGLMARKNGRSQTMTVRNGLPCDKLYGVVMDNHDNLWLNGQCGVMRIARDEVRKWWAHPDAILAVTLLDAVDGAQSSGAAFNPAAKSMDGRLWFVNTSSSLQMVNPDAWRSNSPPPPVHVEDMIANRKPYAANRRVSLPPLIRDLEIDYTATNLAVPQKVRFRYTLEGHEAGWQDAGGRRQAFYTDLPPGNYRFRVTASNDGNVWNEAGAALDFRILPAWYQTTLFRASCGAIFVLTLWGVYRYRLHQLAREFNLRLEARVGERTRIARELHDTLLQSFHGLMFRFQAARNMLPRRPEAALEVLDEALERTEQAIEEGRNAIQDLRSETAAHRHLEHLLAAMGQQLESSQDVDCDPASFRLTVEGERRNLFPVLEDEVYRIACELLRNAFLHAQARQIEAEIRYEDSLLRLRIRDDGKGIDPKVLEQGGRDGHWGLPGMRERAKHIGARLDFWTAQGAGTEAELTVPATVAYGTSANNPGFKLFRKKPVTPAHRA
jgi:signal transduction histidine kinase/ligand-binding sensor domain-containing protein